MSKSGFRELSESDYEQWRPLWDGYLEFYEHSLSEEQTALTWSRFFDPEFNFHAFVLELGGEVVGFAHCSFTVSTWNDKPNLYLEDLFVKPSVRRGGIGTQLILGCAEFARQQGAEKLHWLTHKDNLTAQSVYRKLAKQSEFIIFERGTSSR